MKQVFVGKGTIVVEDVSPPVCGNNEVLVANAYSAISIGTELSIIRNRKGSPLAEVLKSSASMKKAMGYVRKKGIKEAVTTARELQETMVALGYSSAGIAVAVGKRIVDINVGDRVACAGGGKANHAEVVAVPRNLVAVIPDAVSFEEAALHFRRAATFEQWWQAVSTAAGKMEFWTLNLPLVNRDGTSRALNWHHDGDSPDRGPEGLIQVHVPVRDRRSGSSLRLRIELYRDGSLESAGRRVALFTRLIDEHDINNLRIERRGLENVGGDGAPLYL